jgi:hypothetical protein
MPLVFVHGVANRPGPAQSAETAQRDALFRAITFRNQATPILNPDWGSHAVSFSAGMPWLPNPDLIQPFAAGDLAIQSQNVGLGKIAKIDGAQAIDLAILAILDADMAFAGDGPSPETADNDLIALAVSAADYLAPYLSSATAAPKGIAELEAQSDQGFAEALEAELALLAKSEAQSFGLEDRLRDAIGALAGRIGNSISDVALRAKRRSLSQGVGLFLGDIFVYPRNRDIPGPDGTAARLFEPIIVDLIRAANAMRASDEPFVVVGHSLGGVLLYDLLTDAACLARLNAEVPNFHIDCWLTGWLPGRLVR